MESKSKIEVSSDVLHRLFEHHGIFGVGDFALLGDGEYNSLYSGKSIDREYVIKIAPQDNRHALTYEYGMMAQEVATYRLMQAQTAIRVPEIYAVDFTKSMIPSDYFIMEKLPGKTLNDKSWTPAQKSEALAHTLENVAALHGVAGVGFGYPQNGLFPNWHLAIRAMVTNLIDDAKRFGHPCPNGRKLVAFIDRHRSLLEAVESRLVNFDIWEPNLIATMVEDQIQLAWIDPERSFFGDPIADFVSIDFLHMSLSQKQAAIDIYNAHTANPLVVNDGLEIRFAIMLGYLGVIMEVEKYPRYTRKHFGWWRNVAVCKLLFHHCFQTLKRLTKREQTVMEASSVDSPVAKESRT